jgi:hypothetical protein
MSHDRVAVMVTRQAKLQGAAEVVSRKRKHHRATQYRLHYPATAKSSIEYKAALLVRQLSDDPTTDATPFITMLRVCAMVAEFQKWETNALIVEWHRLYNNEPSQDADEERASRSNDWERFIAEHEEESTLHARLAAITEVLVFDRKVDPKQYAPSGARLIR